MFQAKYGTGDELVALFKEFGQISDWGPKSAAQDFDGRTDTPTKLVVRGDERDEEN